MARQLGLIKPKNDHTAALRHERDALATKVTELEAEVVELRQQQPSRYKHGPGGGYILLPPDLIPIRFPEFINAFDPFPHPLPEGWNGLEIPWQKFNVVNAPFRSDDNTLGLGLNAVVPKTVDEQALGNTSLVFIPSTEALNLLAAGHAEMIALGRLKWLHHETKEPWRSPGHTTAFILRGHE